MTRRVPQKNKNFANIFQLFNLDKFSPFYNNNKQLLNNVFIIDIIKETNYFLRKYFTLTL